MELLQRCLQQLFGQTEIHSFINGQEQNLSLVGFVPKKTPNMYDQKKASVNGNDRSYQESPQLEDLCKIRGPWKKSALEICFSYLFHIWD